MSIENSYLRFMKTVVLLRNIRLFSLISYMKIILYVIHHTYSSILNLALILFIFIFTFALFGLNIFGANLSSLTNTRLIYFNTIGQSFMSVFDLITFDNWYELLIDGISNDFTFSMIIFIFSAIILGSYVLLNLFMAIVLEGFEFVSIFYEPKNNNVSKKKLLQNIELKINIAKSPRSALRSNIRNNYKNYAITRDSPLNSRVPRLSSFSNTILRIGARKHAFILNEEEKSLYIFPKSSKME